MRLFLADRIEQVRYQACERLERRESGATRRQRALAERRVGHYAAAAPEEARPEYRMDEVTISDDGSGEGCR